MLLVAAYFGVDPRLFLQLDEMAVPPAYVIAHEVGHHVQNLLGISAKVQEVQQRASTRQAKELSGSASIHPERACRLSIRLIPA